MKITAIDYIVCAIGICVSLAIGMYYAYKDRNRLSLFRYHRGDAKLEAFPVAISLLVTNQSSISFLGYPAEIYVYGVQYFLSSVARAIGYLSIIYVAIPLFYPLCITSVYEYLEKRYGSVLLCRIAIFMNIICFVLYSAIILFGASVSINAVTSIDVWILMIGLATIAVIYTALGGMKAVVFADVIQFCVMVLSILAVLVFGTISAGGIGNVFRLNMLTGRLKLFDFDPDPLVRNSFWALMIGNVGSKSLELCSQNAVQRLSSTRSIQDAKRVITIYIPIAFITELLVMFQGLVAFAHFANKGCDPLASGQINNPNQIIPVTVVDLLSAVPGASGLFFAALCSASLSTLSSLFNSMSAITTVELKKTLFKSYSERKITNVSKVLVVVIACVCVVFAMIIGHVKGPLTQIAATVVYAVGSPMTAIFLLAIFSKRSSVKGVLIGAAVGVIFGSWLCIGSYFSPGTKRTPWLPLGPTFNCHLAQRDVAIPTNTTTYALNTTYTSQINAHDIFLPEMQNSTIESSDVFAVQSIQIENATGLNKLYSISFNYFAVLVAAITVTIGLVFSRIFKANPVEEIEENLTLSICSALLSCLCPLLNRKRRTSTKETEQVEIVEMDDRDMKVPDGAKEKSAVRPNFQPMDEI